MAITSRDQLIAAIAGPSNYTGPFAKLLQASSVRPVSMWTALGGVSPVSMAPPTPTAAASLDATTPGALPVVPCQTPGKTLYLTGLSAISVGGNQAVALYDRAAHIGGLVATSATAQTVAISAGARHTTTVGMQAFLEVNTSAQATLPVVTISYTNSAGVSGRTGTLAATTTSVPQAFTAFVMQTGDMGVASVQSLTWASAVGTAGNYGVVLARPVQTFNIANGSTGIKRTFTTMVDLTVSPCLMLSITGNTGALYGTITTVEG